MSHLSAYYQDLSSCKHHYNFWCCCWDVSSFLEWYSRTKRGKNDESLFDDEKLYPTTAIRRRMNVMELCGWRMGVEKKQRWGSLSFIFVASLLFPSVCELMKSILLFFTSTRRRTRLRFSFNALRHSQWRFSFAPLHFFIFIDSCCWDRLKWSFYFPFLKWDGWKRRRKLFSGFSFKVGMLERKLLLIKNS